MGANRRTDIFWLWQSHEKCFWSALQSEFPEMLMEFLIERRAPHTLMSNSANEEASAKVKRICRTFQMKQRCSEPCKQQQNRAEEKHRTWRENWWNCQTAENRVSRQILAVLFASFEWVAQPHSIGKAWMNHPTTKVYWSPCRHVYFFVTYTSLSITVQRSPTASHRPKNGYSTGGVQMKIQVIFFALMSLPLMTQWSLTLSFAQLLINL